MSPVRSESSSRLFLQLGPMRNIRVVGNWKVHGTRESAHQLMSGVPSGVPREVNAEVILCAPFPYQDLVSRTLAGTRIAWGAR